MSPRSRRAAGLQSPLLSLIVRSLEQRREPNQHDADALRAFGEMAMLQIPSRGLFAPVEPATFADIERILDDTLGFKRPRKAFSGALNSVEPLELRDSLERAASEVRTLSDEGHYYAGLAFGVTFLDLCSTR